MIGDVFSVLSVTNFFPFWNRNVVWWVLIIVVPLAQWWFRRKKLSDKKSWRDIDKGRDKQEYRTDGRSKRTPKLETATAQYKQKLNAFFDRGVVPDHLKDKLPEGENKGPSERQVLLRKIRQAKTNQELVKAVDKLVGKYGLPEDPEIWLRALEHPSDQVLASTLELLEAFLDSGQVLKRKGLFAERLKGLEFVSFDPRVQSKAIRLAGRLG